MYVDLFDMNFVHWLFELLYAYVHLRAIYFSIIIIEHLRDASNDDWQKHIKVQFVGKRGIGIGSLKRVFFSLLVLNQCVFIHGGFHHDFELVD